MSRTTLIRSASEAELDESASRQPEKRARLTPNGADDLELRIRILQTQCCRYWKQSSTLYADNPELRRCNADVMELRRELEVLKDSGNTDHIS